MTLAGDLRLLDRLVAEHLPAAMRFAARLTGNGEAAEELVQEALYRAVRGVGSFRGQAQFRTWFYRILITAFRDQLVAAARRPYGGELAEGLAGRDDDPAATAMLGELQELVARQISSLPPRQREVLLLISYEQLRPSEAAEVLGISESSVHANLHYARARLREELAAYLSEK
jgi:RNA polymerase sigma-70 factor, ECF subfamily